MYQRDKEGSEENTCQHRIFEEDWKEQEKKAYNLEYPLEIVVVRGPFLKQQSINSITFPANVFLPKMDENGETYEQMWSGYEPSTLQVLISYIKARN